MVLPRISSARACNWGIAVNWAEISGKISISTCSESINSWVKILDGDVVQPGIFQGKRPGIGISPAI